MSFLRPTKSSLRRTQTTLEEQSRQIFSANSSTSTIGAAQQLHPRPVLHETPMPDYSHVTSRVDSGLYSRVQNPLSGRRHNKSTVQVDPSTRSPSLREFTATCDDIIQRAQKLLDRTREQEVLVAKALEERRSRSPWHCAGTPSPPLSQGDRLSAQQQQQEQQTTPTRWLGGLSSSPAVPAPPQTTPVVPTHAAAVGRGDGEGVVEGTPVQAQRAAPPSPSRHGPGEWFGLRAQSPSPPPLPAPPPTPAELPGSLRLDGSATKSINAPATTGGGSAKRANVSSSPSSSSFLQRIRQSLQRTAHGTVDTSPVPLPPDIVAKSIAAIQSSSANRVVQASPRKSVKFVSADKLESVTPTKVVIFPDSDSSSSEEQEEDEDGESEEAATTSVRRPSYKKLRAEKLQSTTPKRDSMVLPSAPPPSAVKSRAKEHEDAIRHICSEDGGNSSGNRRSSSTSPQSPSNASQRTRSPTSSPHASRGRSGSCALTSPRASSSDSARHSRTHVMHHDELKAYVMQHTIRQSLAYLSKAEMTAFLKEEGSSLARQHDVMKKHLLTEIRALLRKQAEV